MKPLQLIFLYIFLLHFGPLLNLFGLLPGARVFPITTVGHALMVFLTLKYFTSLNRKGFTRLDMAVFAFTAWSICSVVLYFQPNNPTDINAYAYGIHLYVMPIFGYFAIKTLDIADQRRALKAMLGWNVFLLAFGLYLWYVRPDYYNIFLREVMFTTKEEWNDWQIYLRLQSYLGSTAVGCLCSITLAMAGAYGLSPLKTLAVISTVVPAVVLSFQRGGQATTALAMLYIMFFAKGSKAARPLIIVASLVLSAAAVVFITQKSEAGLEYYLSRKDDYHSLLQGRRGYTVGWEYISAFPLGVGVGGSGNAAQSAGFAQLDKVVDANFMRIFADLGVPGILTFFVVLGLSLEAAVKRSRNTGYACIILIYMIVALGTNVWDGHLTPQLFWLVLGLADTPVEETEAQAELASDEQPVDHEGLSSLEPAPQNRAIG